MKKIVLLLAFLGFNILHSLAEGVKFLEDGKLCVQNEKFDNGYYRRSERISLGKNVTTFKEEGPVVVSGQDVILKGTEGVDINNSFEVQQGASLLITN